MPRAIGAGKYFLKRGINMSNYIPIYYQVADDRKLNHRRKYLLSLIISLLKNSGVCYPSNKYLSEKVGCVERVIQQDLIFLETNGYIIRTLKSKLRTIIPSSAVAYMKELLPNFDSIVDNDKNLSRKSVKELRSKTRSNDRDHKDIHDQIENDHDQNDKGSRSNNAKDHDQTRDIYYKDNNKEIIKNNMPPASPPLCSSFTYEKNIANFEKVENEDFTGSEYLELLKVMCNINEQLLEPDKIKEVCYHVYINDHKEKRMDPAHSINAAFKMMKNGTWEEPYSLHKNQPDIQNEQKFIQQGQKEKQQDIKTGSNALIGIMASLGMKSAALNKTTSPSYDKDKNYSGEVPLNNKKSTTG